MVESGARRNGFTLPTNVFQVISWAIYIYFNGIFYAFLFLSLPTSAMIVTGILFGIFSIISGAAAALATAKDPADPSIYTSSDANASAMAADTTGKLFCNRCDAFVDESSKHCTTCRKCVHRFDHHCVWLNTCVGSATYRSFFGLLVGVAGLLSVLLAVCLYIIIQYSIHEDILAADLHDKYSGASTSSVFALAVATTVLSVVVFLLVVQLLGFHIHLVAKNLTTYDYIMMRQRQYAGLPAAGPPAGGGAYTSLCEGAPKQPKPAGQQAVELPQRAAEAQDSATGPTAGTYATRTSSNATALPKAGAAGLLSVPEDEEAGHGVPRVESESEGEVSVSMGSTGRPGHDSPLQHDLPPQSMLSAASEMENEGDVAFHSIGRTQQQSRLAPVVTVSDDLPKAHDRDHLQAYTTEVNPPGHTLRRHAASQQDAATHGPVPAPANGVQITVHRDAEEADAAHDDRNAHETAI